jgi:hypothetical protein
MKKNLNQANEANEATLQFILMMMLYPYIINKIVT